MQTAFLSRQAHDGILALMADRTCVLDACRLHHRHVVVADPEHWAMDMCPERNVAVAQTPFASLEGAARTGLTS